jgi:hypothetical protein
MIWLLFLALSQEASAPKSTIRGIVLDHAAGTPIAEAKVSIRFEQSPDGTGQLHSMNERGASTVTAANGEFELEAPAGIPFHVSAARDGFIPYGDKAFRTSDSPTIKLEAGENRVLPPIRLSSGAILAGRLTDKETGKPIQGIAVSALLFSEGRPGSDRYAFPSGQRSVSDADGRFSIGSLMPGEYRLHLDANLKTQARTPKEDKPAEAAFGYPMSFYPGVREYSQALTIQVTPGARLEYLDMKLEKVRVHTIRGELSGDAEKGILTVFTQFELGWGFRVGQLGKLDKLGPFEIVNVYPGRMHLAFWAKDSNNDPRRQQAMIDLDVVEDVKDLDVSMAYGHPLHVSVEPPIERQVQISIFPTKRISDQADRYPSFAGNKGAVLNSVFAEELRVGLYDIPKSWIVTDVKYNGEAVEPNEFRLNPMHTDHKLVFHVAEVQNGISGRVKPGYRVVAARAPLGKHDTDARAKKTTADESGGYSFSQLNPGKWYVLQIAPAHTWASGLQLLREGKGELCEVAEKAICSLSPREP